MLILSCVPHFSGSMEQPNFNHRKEKEMTKLNYVDAAGLKPKVAKTQPEAMLVLCLLNQSVGSHRAELVTDEIVKTLEKLGFVVKRK
jgi:hypothetical protein